MLAIQVAQYGAPEVLRPVELEDPSPATGEVVIHVEATGVNFIDVYQRTGRYPGTLPFIPGQEGAGTVEAVGPRVTGLARGDRVAFAGAGSGGYASLICIPAERVVPIPIGVSALQAAAALLQGMTAHFLCESTYPVQAKDTVLIHAGAGGVGLLLTQMCRKRGARVLTTVSTDVKAELSTAAGAHATIAYTQTDFAEEVRRLTDGAGVEVVYDSVGKTTFDKSLDCLKPRGTMVLFGGSSGPVPPFDPMVLSKKGSLFLTRPTLGHHIADRASLLRRASEVLNQVASNELKLRIDRSYPLRQASAAHADLEGRKTSGKLLLLPGL